MKITKKLIQEFVDTVPLDIHYVEGKLMTVGVHYRHCQDADEMFGRQTVLKILDLLENDKKYQKLLD